MVTRELPIVVRVSRTGEAVQVNVACCQDRARAYLAEVSQRMDLPATDPYRFGADVLVDALAAL